MTATMLNPFQQARIIFRDRFKKGIKPTDPRQPIADELALEMVQELKDLDVPTDALIGVYDAFMILSTHLKEAGYTNLVLLENSHKGLTSSQKEYYNAVEKVCENSNIKYYVPPMNNYNRCNMEFDVVIGNPPYQSPNGGGSQRGSTISPLWHSITKQSFKFLKKDGILSFITPSNIVKGGDHFTEMFLGSERQYDLKTLDFNVNEDFSIGTHICRWTATKSKTSGNTVSVSDGRVISSDKALKIFDDVFLDQILNTMFNSDIDSFNFNQSKSWTAQGVKTLLKKDNQSVELADLSDTETDEYCYPVNVNGKIKYSRVKWKNTGTWRVFYPQLQNPTEITVDDVAEAAPSTFTMVVDSEAEGNTIKAILDDPLYQWVIEKTRVSGRVTGIISKMPNAPIQQVLTDYQLSYIQSQLS